jgi:hypothetical protein
MTNLELKVEDNGAQFAVRLPLKKGSCDYTARVHKNNGVLTIMSVGKKNMATRMAAYVNIGEGNWVHDYDYIGNNELTFPNGSVESSALDLLAKTYQKFDSER